MRNMSEVKQSNGLGGTCKIPEQPACPPCETIPRPVCRPPEPAHGPRGLRRVCCAPSAGHRPPCTPTPMACSKTCKHANEKQNVDHCEISKCSRKQQEKCGDNLDRVAKRLAAAEHIRRLDYEREIAEKKPVPAFDPVFYNLLDERECLRATDGHDYTTSKKSKTQPQCGPCRTPPPPCPVNLEAADNCKIIHSQHLDPCAHRPRIFLEIDRSQNSSSTNKSVVSMLNPKKGFSAGSTSTSRSSTSGSLTSRIMETLKNSKGSCQKRPCEKTCTNGNAKYAGDKSWCANIPTPSPVPANCKEPSLTDRLRRRSGPLCSKPCGSSRRIHTKTCVGKFSETKNKTETSQSDSNISKLELILNERLQLKEAGLGRVILTQQQVNKTNPLSSGLMELPIPPTSDSVSVRVSLNFENSKPSACDSSRTSHFPISQNLSSCTDGCGGSWLLIKNLQKKFTACRKHDLQHISEKKVADIGTCRPKPESNKDPLKPRCTPKTLGEVGLQGKTTKPPFPLSHTTPESTCRGNSRQDAPK